MNTVKPTVVDESGCDYFVLLYVYSVIHIIQKDGTHPPTKNIYELRGRLFWDGDLKGIRAQLGEVSVGE